ncbi:hypothetical protein M3Y98_00905900 [Aphelenchoides besseyi]|nr:hypothetical protein M3Y98_00905900 [Aphelenchoides besseyi]
MVLFLVNFFHWCIYVAEGTSLMLNTIVIYLASTETTKDLKEYKNLLILNGIVDYTCTLIGVWNHENMEITQGVWVHMFGWPANMFPKSWHYVFVGAYSMKLAVSDYKYTDHTFLMSNPFIFNDENPHPTIVIGELNSLPMYELIISTALVGNVLICFMIAYFTYDTIRKLEEMKVHMAPRTRKLQSQMNRTLFAQTVSVFATALIPLLVLVFMMLSAIEVMVQWRGSTKKMISDSRNGHLCEHDFELDTCFESVVYYCFGSSIQIAISFRLFTLVTSERCFKLRIVQSFLQRQYSNYYRLSI